MQHILDMGVVVYLNAAINQFAITVGKELFTMRLIINLLGILRMAESGLVEK
jgi:hypothetical protein